jgi:signal transduction histidine kinase
MGDHPDCTLNCAYRAQKTCLNSAMTTAILPPGSTPVARPLLRRPLLRRPRQVLLGGVCSAIATHLGWSVRRTRLLAVGLALCAGAGILFYLWLWALVPLEPTRADDPAQVRRTVPVASLLVASAALAVLFVLNGLAVNSITAGLLFVIAASGAAVVWSLAVDRQDPTRTRRYGPWVRSLSSLLLLFAGTVTLLSRPAAIDAILGVAMVVLGIAVLAAPRVVGLWSDLMNERATRVREEQRAEIAAHLHDSVLQTLALIQNRAGASSEVARIARAQERELRDWLFIVDSPVADDLAAALRESTAAIELDHAVRIDVVATGASVPGISALVAAAREAILNAARHAGGDVSVYLETSPRAIDVFVRDRGPGVDLAALPADRLGIRESIIGRMTRVGGTATVRPGAGSVGTEVHLHLEHSLD